jgi:hypothetical protein
MHVSDAEYNGLLARVGKLEAKQRMWKRATLFVVAALGLAFAANVTAQENAPGSGLRATTVEAQKFQLRDAQGRLTGLMTIEDGKPILQLYDADGNVTWSTEPRAARLEQTK